MGASFVAASSQYLSNSVVPVLPTTGYPFTFAAWINTTAVGAAQTIMSFGDTGTTNNFIGLTLQTTGSVAVIAAAGGVTASAGTGTAVTAGTWNFCVGRFISSGNRWAACLFSSGAIDNIQTVIFRAPPSLDKLGIGTTIASTNLDFFGGIIAEAWYTNTDINPLGNAVAIDSNFLRQIAYYGPFSVPSLAKDIIEYRGLRTTLGNDRNKPDEIYCQLGTQTWVNNGSTTIGAHAPLSNLYARPRQFKIRLVV